jgi:putative PIN family toxin of toxin-antitoxin system
VTAWRVVLDAQVWVSAAINSAGPARKIIDAAVAGELRIVTSPYIHAEVLEVFSRPAVRRFLAHGFDPAAWLDFVELTAADVVEEAVGPPVVPADPDDDPYLWTAYVGAATHIVTWDAEVLGVKHFHGAQVVEPGELLRQLPESPG